MFNKNILLPHFKKCLEGVKMRNEGYRFSDIAKQYLETNSEKFIEDNAVEGVRVGKQLYCTLSTVYDIIVLSAEPKAVALIAQTMKMAEDELKEIKERALIDSMLSKKKISNMENIVDKVLKENDELINVFPDLIEPVSYDPDEKPQTRTYTLTLIKGNDPDFFEKYNSPSNAINVLSFFGIPIFLLACPLLEQSFYVMPCDIFNTHFRIIMKSSDTRLLKINDTEGKTNVYFVVDNNFFNTLQLIKAPNPFIYTLQVEFWPDLGVSFLNKVNNEKEYQSLYWILKELGDTYTFTFQKTIMNYRADAIFSRRGNISRKFKDICVEVNEDAHRDRDPDKDKLKKNVIRICGYQLFDVDVMRADSPEAVKEVAMLTVQKIRAYIKTSTLQMCSSKVLKAMRQYVIEANVNDEFAEIFFDSIEDLSDPFKFRHDQIAIHLGYNDQKDNYRLLRDIITSNYSEGVDYVVKIEGNFKKKIYYLNALTFNHVCCDVSTPKSASICKQFATVYNLTTEYLVINTLCSPENQPEVELVIEEIMKAEIARVIKENNDSMEKKESEMRKKHEIECTKLKKENQTLKEENHSLRLKIKSDEKNIQDAIEKIKTLSIELQNASDRREDPLTEPHNDEVKKKPTTKKKKVKETSSEEVSVGKKTKATSKTSAKKSEEVSAPKGKKHLLKKKPNDLNNKNFIFQIKHQDGC